MFNQFRTTVHNFESLRSAPSSLLVLELQAERIRLTTYVPDSLRFDFTPISSSLIAVHAAEKIHHGQRSEDSFSSSKRKSEIFVITGKCCFVSFLFTVCCDCFIDFQKRFLLYKSLPIYRQNIVRIGILTATNHCLKDFSLRTEAANFFPRFLPP